MIFKPVVQQLSWFFCKNSWLLDITAEMQGGLLLNKLQDTTACVSTASGMKTLGSITPNSKYSVVVSVYDVC